MRTFAIGSLLTLTIALGVFAHGQGTQAQAPKLAGSYQVASQDGGQPTLLLLLNSDGTATATDTKGAVRLGAWVTKEDGTLAVDLRTLADVGGAQGMLIDGPVAEQADGTFTLGDEYRLTRITP